MCIPPATSASARAVMPRISPSRRPLAGGPGRAQTETKEKHQMARNMSVIGIYQDRTTVSDAINVLHKAGYRATDISVLSSDNQGSKDFAHEKQTKAAKGAASGAIVGAAIGAALACLVSVQAVSIAGLAPLVAAGPMLASLAGAGAGGVLGWIVGLLAGVGLSEY